ncbi:hypothetical protein [Cellvibrio sp. pealriver]|uniref:hypothetical protein n=1 Tax=Cellvibrio sp. pealriver TaxID=1622269 RepID=UPI00066FF73F|nr:hypothetical protein [Cellvibrio sp. pealriver]
MKFKFMFSMVIVLLVGFGYFVVVSFSEHREYQKFSVDYWILTPKEIGSLSGFCSDTPGFIYSAADGAKPLIVQLKCLAKKSEIVDYLERDGFSKINEKSYRKDKQEIELVYDDGEKMNMATLMIFL